MDIPIDPKHLSRIKRAVNSLNKVLKEIQEYEPDAGWYLDGTCNLNLMRGPSHDDQNGHRPCHHNVIDSWYLHYAGGGDW